MFGQVKTSPKLKHFLWKIKNNAIPVGDSLLRREIAVERLCKRCGALDTRFNWASTLLQGTILCLLRSLVISRTVCK